MEIAAMLMVALATVSLLTGVCVGWLMAKSRTSALVQAATAEARGATQVELATLGERLASTTAGLETAKQDYSSLKASAEQWRSELDTSQQDLAGVRAQLQSATSTLGTERAQAQALLGKYERVREELDDSSNSIATLTERASRVESLESELVTQTESLRAKDAQLRQVSTENGQSSEKAAQLTEQSAALRSSLADTTARLETATSEVKRLAQENAALGEQAARLPSSEQEVSKLRGLLATGEKDLSELREASAGHVSRLTAELAGERDAYATLRQEHEVQRSASQRHAERVTALSEELSELRESSSSQVSRLTAELAGEHEVHIALRQEYETQRAGAQKLLEQASSQSEELSGMREMSAGQVSKLTAELAADRETLAALRQEHETQRREAARHADRAAIVAQELSELRESTTGQVSKLTAELASEKEALQLARRDGDASKSNATELTARVLELTEELTGLRSKTDQERAGADEKLQLLVQAKEELSQQFKVLATEILEEKSRRFAEQNNVSLGQLLDPLRTQLHEFKGKVEEVYVQEGKDRVALAEQVKQLMGLNQTLSQDANNLTQALKGQAKTQGNWGELILERVLEASGLRKGSEYRVQDSQRREDGTLAQPDVVIELPEERKLVVDAKVSLVSYERYMSAGTDADRQVAAKMHLESVRAHIRGLSDKRYNELYGIQSPDFVLAFVPVEPAFMLAVAQDNDLFMDAWSRNVLLVSPSTLLFVVRTVAHLWRQEHQTRNSQEIARRGALLYDKLSGFVTDLQKVGDKLSQAQAAFADANGKLTAGNGNVIRQAEMLRDLGVKPTKVLPAAIIQAAGVEDTGLPVLALDVRTAAMQ